MEAGSSRRPRSRSKGKSRRASKKQKLDEEAQLLLAIQRSMDTSVRPATANAEILPALELSPRPSTSKDTESLPVHDRPPPAEAASDSAQLWVLAPDETSLVVACAALRKAVLSHLNMVIMEGAGGAAQLAHVLPSLERKYNVKVTVLEGQIQIQGFLNSPSQCRQELQQTLDSLQATDWAQPSMMTLNSQQDVELVDVPRDSEEYERVVQPFLQTSRDQRIDIYQVQKVQNPLLYNQYQLKKQRMTMMDASRPAERILYHGTPETSAREICHHGFNRSFCGKNAVMFGQGVYFAVRSEVSMDFVFSRPNKDGKRFILVARVLTGEFTVGHLWMQAPPLMPGPSPEGLRRYDSLVDNLKNPTIFVIFNDTQAYPEYLITINPHLNHMFVPMPRPFLPPVPAGQDDNRGKRGGRSRGRGRRNASRDKP